MTQKRILELATDAALAKWSAARQSLNDRPDSRIAKYREANAWAEYREASEMLAAIEAEEAGLAG